MKSIILFLSVLVGGTFAITIPSESYNSRIHSGFLATADQFPYQGRLLFNDTAVACTCTIISTVYVIAPASCTRKVNIPYSLRFGTIDMAVGGQTRTSTIAFEHPRYNEGTLIFDIAIVVLFTQLIININIAPIQLPAVSHMLNSFIDHDAITIGWGPMQNTTVRNLRWADMRILPVSDCESQSLLQVDGDNTICAVGIRQQALCEADNGAPLVISDRGVPTLIGMSYGEQCNGNIPTTYLRIAHLLAWINSLTGIHLHCVETFELALEQQVR